VRREALTTIGFFSEEFSPGYGEEVDFSLRAVKAGFVNVLSNSVIVLHQEGLSFGSHRDALIEQHETLLREKHPDFDQYLSSYAQSFENVEAIFSRAITKKHGV
jgi:GT2 family glycosyltransferase